MPKRIFKTGMRRREVIKETGTSFFRKKVVYAREEKGGWYGEILVPTTGEKIARIISGAAGIAIGSYIYYSGTATVVLTAVKTLLLR